MVEGAPVTSYGMSGSGCSQIGDSPFVAIWRDSPVQLYHCVATLETFPYQLEVLRIDKNQNIMRFFVRGVFTKKATGRRAIYVPYGITSRHGSTYSIPPTMGIMRCISRW